jgi:SAM-dependent methyltransferase
MPRRARSCRLNPRADAYGRILLAIHEGRRASEIMERDDGLIYTGDPADYFAPFRRWPRAEREAMRHSRGRVLDVGCAAGRVSLHLERRGHDVVAIDESPLAIEVARRRGVRGARTMRLADVTPALGLFDTVVILRNNFGLAGAGRPPRAVLERLARLTSARGRIITDSVNPRRIADPAIRAGALRDARGGAGHRFRVRWMGFASPWFRYTMVPPAAMRRLVAGSGWRVTHIIDDGSPRYVVVLEKSGAKGRRPASRSR